MRKTTTPKSNYAIWTALSVLLAFSFQIAYAQDYDFQPGPDGIIVMEAEHFSENVPNGLVEWFTVQEPAEYSGDGAMMAVTDQSFGTAESALAGAAKLVYKIDFTETGTHYVWARASATSGSDDSYHVGLDGVIPVSGTFVNWEQSTGAKDGTWAWILWTNGKDGPQCSVEITEAGVHNLEVYIRENGFRIDKLVVTKIEWNSGLGYAPEGAGPDETPAVSGIFSARAADEMFSIQPNPVGNRLEIFMKDGVRMAGTIEIIDITGKVVRRLDADYRRVIRADVSGLESGVYFVKLDLPGKTGSVKKMLKL
jgi:hypothetical protein